MQNDTIDGKDIVLQRIKNSTVTKTLKFIEEENRYKNFDLKSSRYKFYLKKDNENVFVFSQIKKSDFEKEINNNIKPKILSEKKYKEIKKNENNFLKYKELIDSAVNNYDEKTNRYYNKLVHFENKILKYKKDFRRNILYKVDYLITGKLENGEILRFPFYLEEAELKINPTKKEVKINTLNNGKILSNYYLINWLGNYFKIPIEKELEKIYFLKNENKIKSQLDIYKKLGIKLNLEDFSLEDFSELNFKKENNSFKVDYEVAFHEIKHLMVALEKKIDVNSVEINNFRDKLGSINTYYNNFNENDLLIRLAILIAPLSKEEINLIINGVEQKINEESDIYKAIEIFKKIDLDLNEKIDLLWNIYYENNNLFIKKKKSINLFIEHLLKHKFMDGEEILEQYSSEEHIESFYDDVNEMKLEKNVWKVEKVNFIGLYENLEDNEIFNDIKKIFNESNFVENLLDYHSSLKNEKKEFEEKEINWAFDSDIYQQKAVFYSKQHENFLIKGPPGTGKTQTILNLISDNISNNKTTLIISDKITALDVIYKKILKYNKELEYLVLNLYDEGNLKIKFYNSMYKIIDFFKLYWEKFYLNSNIKSIEENQNFFLSNFKKNIKNIENIEKDFKILENEKYIPENIKRLEPSEEEIKKIKKTNYSLNKILEILNFSSLYNYDDFYFWSEQYSKFRKFDNNFNYPYEKTFLLKLLKIEEPYNEFTKFKYLSEFTGKKFKNYKIFYKRKLNKMIDEKYFLEKYFYNKNQKENLSFYLKFNSSKYSEKEIVLFQQYKKLKNLNFDKNRILEIKDYYDLISNIKEISKKISLINFEDFPSLNNKDFLKNNIKRALYNHYELVDNVFSKNPHLKSELIRIQNRKIVNKPLKLFIKNYFNDIHKLFPVILSTPEQVSEKMPLKENYFDCVIIDEASQLLVEKSLPSIYRAKNITILGDEKQLQPNFFGKRIDEKFIENHTYVKNRELIENLSILDLYNEILSEENKIMLKTHYRSSKRELIDFFNKKYYKKELKFIEKQIDKDIFPIEVFDIKSGKWKDQTNLQEAEFIVKKLKKLFKKNLNESIGVILFSKKQANLVIEKLLETNDKILIEKYTSFGNDSLFIKSIDEVQGEERDIIIFGIGYGNNVFQYGYLSRKYGENRINVAISRPKNKIILVKSHKSYEYRKPPINSISNGPKDLIEFIEYCENLVQENNKEQPLSNLQKDFLGYLKKKYTNFNEYKINVYDNFWYFSSNKDVYLLLEKNLLKNLKENFLFIIELLSKRGYKVNIETYDQFIKSKINNINIKNINDLERKFLQY